MLAAAISAAAPRRVSAERRTLRPRKTPQSPHLDLHVALSSHWLSHLRDPSRIFAPVAPSVAQHGGLRRAWWFPVIGAALTTALVAYGSQRRDSPTAN